MVKVTRKEGQTTIEWANGFKITTDKINRYRYNELRKKKLITIVEVMLLLRQGVRKGTSKVKAGLSFCENSIFSHFVW